MPVRLTILGAGDAFGSHGRFQASYLIEGGGRKILLEAGPTVLPVLKHHGFKAADLDLILISHLHGDHFNGLGYLILEYLFESKLKRGLTIAGPPGLEKRTFDLFRAMYKETDIGPVAKRLKFVEARPGHPMRLHGIGVHPIRTHHTIKDISLAYRLTIDGKTIAFTGDTGWMDELLEFSAGADLFLCECTYFDTNLDIHIGYPTLAAKRGSITARRTVLTHLGREVLDRIDEVDFEIGFDGMKIEL